LRQWLARNLAGRWRYREGGWQTAEVAGTPPRPPAEPPS
jgi:hypothetical protein